MQFAQFLFVLDRITTGGFIKAFILKKHVHLPRNPEGFLITVVLSDFHGLTMLSWILQLKICTDQVDEAPSIISQFSAVGLYFNHKTNFEFEIIFCDAISDIVTLTVASAKADVERDILHDVSKLHDQAQGYCLHSRC